MATFSTNHMDLVEAFKRENFTNAESLLGGLIENNDLLRTAAVLPSSNGSYHKTLVADKLGTGAFRGAYEAIKQTNSVTHMVSEPIVSYEGESEVDELILKGADNPATARMTEDMMNLQGISNGFNSELIYCSPSKATENFRGLAARRNKIGTYCINCGGTAANALSSAYLIEMGETAFSFRYAKGTMPGISKEDMGLNKCEADGGGHYWGWVTKYAIALGVAIRQENALFRLANIDPTSDNIASFFENIIRAKNKLPSRGKGAFLYVNADVQSVIEIMTMNKAQYGLSIRDIEGYGPVAHFLNVPVLCMDAITSTEAKLS